MEIKKDTIPLKTKINYGLGSLGLQLTTGLFAAWTLTFYIKIVKIDFLLWALAWIIYLVWNAVNDPLFGFFSDNTNTKYGRRIPFIMVCGPLMSISFVLLYLTPTDSEQWVYFIWLLVTLIAYDSFFTIVGLCFNALMSELSIEPDERAKMNLFASIGGGLGLSITYALPILFIQNVQPYSQNRPIFLTIVIVVAILGAMFLSFTAFGIKERPELMPEEDENLGLWQAMKTTLKNKSFLIFAVFNFMMTFVIVSVMSILPFYIQDVLQVSSESPLGSLPLILYLGFSLLGLPVGILMNQKYGNKHAIIYLSVVVITGFIMVTVANDIIWASISFAIIGFGFSGQTVLVYTVLADVIDQDELETGVRREGMYFGTNALITKPAQSVAAAIAGLVFYLTLYNQDLGPGESQPASAIFGIKLLMGLIPTIFIIIGMIVLWRYPLNPRSDDYKEMKQACSDLHDEKLRRCRERLACLEEENRNK
ncbi:MAG: MFS transporter [Promethearchaeota archaeon]|nr:MAG: MFS transporter [Candidatus Lokiarchaeota archaeon]